MWLINVDTLELENHYGTHRVYRPRRHGNVGSVDSSREVKDLPAESEHFIPPYAILSHTWSDREFTFQEFQALKTVGHELRAMEPAYQKIKRTCEQAKKDGLRYAWVDTCCIDKTSSAELQEAINSMFSWYAESTRSYALLEDYDVCAQTVPNQGLTATRWFSRGWTLQELIAPLDLKFFDKHWMPLGKRSSLAKKIADSTGVSMHVLSRDGVYGGNRTRRVTHVLSSFSIAQRLSWASKRQTSRKEDEAYCLLGLFDVNMPLLYGEGSKAFVRLQESILRQGSDISLIAWGASNTTQSMISWDRDFVTNVFSDSASSFEGASVVVQRKFDNDSRRLFEPELVASGLRLQLPVLPMYHSGQIRLVGILNVGLMSDVHNLIGLKLRCADVKIEKDSIKYPLEGPLVCELGWGGDWDSFRRRTVLVDFVKARTESSVREVVIKRAPELGSSLNRVTDHAGYIWLRVTDTRITRADWEVIDAWPEQPWDKSSKIYECFNVSSSRKIGSSAETKDDLTSWRNLCGFSSESPEAQGHAFECEPGTHYHANSSNLWGSQSTMACSAVSAIHLRDDRGMELCIAFEIRLDVTLRRLHYNLAQSFQNSLKCHIERLSTQDPPLERADGGSKFHYDTEERPVVEICEQLRRIQTGRTVHWHSWQKMELKSRCENFNNAWFHIVELHVSDGRAMSTPSP